MTRRKRHILRGKLQNRRTRQGFRDGTLSWDVRKENYTDNEGAQKTREALYINGVRAATAPQGWSEREKNYNDSMRIFR